MKKFSTPNYAVTCAEINARDMVDFFRSIGHQPTRTSPPNYWYLSPLREEKTASFKVNRRLNRWYDFGIQEGGSLIDFCMRYYRCGLCETIAKLSGPVLALTNVPRLPSKPRPVDKPSITRLETRPLQTPALLHYLRSRRIDENVAQQYCCEASYQAAGKSWYAIAFKNDAGGYELRNSYFKGGNSPKSPTFIDRQAARLCIFEGFFDFLSFVTIIKTLNMTPVNFLILNSVGMLDRALPVIQGYPQIWSFLDNDPAGDDATAKLLRLVPAIDQRVLYKGHKDLNAWLCGMRQSNGLAHLFPS